MARKIADLPKNIPIPPSASLERFAFPGDLLAENRPFYTQIEMVEYSITSSVSNPFLNPVGGVILPLPKTINDQQTVVWEEVSATSVAGSILNTVAGAAAGGAIGGSTGAAIGSAVSGNIGSIISNAAGVGGAVIGKTINPFLTMLFKSPAFKEHTLSWSFAPTNAQEAQNLSDIIHYFKYSMLPETVGWAQGALLSYPNLAIIKFYPKDEFLFKFKPCAITAVQVDYTGSGGLSFHQDGAPTVINLTLQLKEIEYHLKDTYSK